MCSVLISNCTSRNKMCYLSESVLFSGTKDRKHWDNGKCGLHVNRCCERATTNPLRLHPHLSFYFCAAAVCRCVLLWLDDHICTALWDAACISVLVYLRRQAFIAESWLCHEFLLTPLNDQREAWGWNEAAKTYLQKLIWPQIHIFVYKYPT